MSIGYKEQCMPQQPEWTREDFMAFILDHREKPRNNRKMEDASVHVTGGNPGCGDIVSMYLKVGDEEKVEDISFIGEGCTISQAGASFMTTRLKGKTISEINEMEYDIIFETFGREVMATRPRCATLALETAKAAAKKYRDDQRRASLGETPEPDSDTPIDAT
jgi:nitrogen fixation NifU-like protein